MQQFFEEFEAKSKSDWEAQLIKDLKDASIDELKIINEVEGIAFDSYQHEEDIPENFVASEPKKRNSWFNVIQIEITNEKEANEKALHELMHGVDGICFVASTEKTDWPTVLHDIKSEYINLSVRSTRLEDFEALNNISPLKFNYYFDRSIESIDEIEFQKIAGNLILEQLPFFEVNMFESQQIGANCSQQIVYALLNGHELLYKLMQHGLSVDQASACISFNIGIGSNYFLETAKINVLKKLWSKIVYSYNPKHACSVNCQIHVTIGLLNKSLNDPYTNLLRQTTEALSALNAGIDSICILPYDSESKKPTDLAQRMAQNIPLILKEESYIDKVSSPLNGSYNMIALENLLGMSSWSEFVDSENLGGWCTPDCRNKLIDKISVTRNLRIERIKSGKDILIGVNKYSNPDIIQNDWLEPNNFLGLSHLRLELETKSVLS